VAGKRHPWPKDGFVAVAGAESPQRYVFVPVESIEGSTSPNKEHVLRTSGEQRWLSNAEALELRRELDGLIATAGSPTQEEALRTAVSIVDYELARGTGVLVVPPGALNAVYHPPLGSRSVTGFASVRTESLDRVPNQ
jgi:hypothetical protein